MKSKELDSVVLERDLPEHNLRRGDLGAVVQVYEPDGLEVEFVTKISCPFARSAGAPRDDYR